MKKIVLKYLNKNYRFKITTYNDFLIKDRISGHDVKLSEVMKSIYPIFDVSETEASSIFDIWCDQQDTLVNNRIVAVQEMLHKEGIDIELSPSQMNEIVENNQTFINRYDYIPYHVH